MTSKSGRERIFNEPSIDCYGGASAQRALCFVPERVPWTFRGLEFRMFVYGLVQVHRSALPSSV
ncbi:MAG: hypothetical protein VX405_09280, partial [Myxococcota bacterium]|nr:hypothetical protein [Myxococcota bacterium]